MKLSDSGPVATPHDLFQSDTSKVAFLPPKVFLTARFLYRRLSYCTGRKTSPFALYKTENIIFIHVPKNAGTFINSVVYPSLPAAQSTKINAHHSALYLKRLNAAQFARMPKFAILRHPANRLESAFNYLKFNTPFETDKIFAETSLKDFETFENFCRSITAERFEQLLSWPHFQPQISFICDSNGAVLVNALTSIESISAGFPNLGAHLGKNWNGITNTASDTPPPVVAMDLVNRHYARDLALWGQIEASRDRLILL